MATQCHRLAVHSPAARFSIPYACSSSSSRFSSRVNQSSVFLRGQRLQWQRMSQHSLSSSARPAVQCESSTVGSSSSEGFDKSGGERVQNNVISNIWVKAPEPIRVFPWGKAWSLFLQRVVYHFWTVGKWLAIPVLAVSMLSELSYTLMQERVLIIPAAMVGGFAFAGMMKETALELSSEFETGEIAWHLVALGLFFAALKFIAPYLPTLGRITVPHFANEICKEKKIRNHLTEAFTLGAREVCRSHSSFPSLQPSNSSPKTMRENAQSIGRWQVWITILKESLQECLVFMKMALVLFAEAALFSSPYKMKCQFITYQN